MTVVLIAAAFLVCGGAVGMIVRRRRARSRDVRPMADVAVELVVAVAVGVDALVANDLADELDRLEEGIERLRQGRYPPPARLKLAPYPGDDPRLLLSVAIRSNGQNPSPRVACATIVTASEQGLVIDVEHGARACRLEYEGPAEVGLSRAALQLRSLLTRPADTSAESGEVLDASILRWAASLADESGPGARDVFDSVFHDLAAALEADRRNALLNYNLGALLYTSYGHAEMERAVDHFTIAFSSSVRWVQEPREPTDGRFAAWPGSQPTMVAGLALTGLALCYGQLAHRFGEISEERLVNCRVTADRAVEIMQSLHDERGDIATKVGLLRARYAQAFSLHITEEPEDVARSIAVYEDVVENWEQTSLGVPGVILNNLGYQYMQLAGRWERGTRTDLYEAAHLPFERSQRVDPEFFMAWANLGNLHRLFKRYDAAVAAYRTALEKARQQRTAYPAGHSELARVLLEMGRIEEAAAEHRSALDLCRSAPERARYVGEWAAGLFAVRRDVEAREAAEHASALHDKEHHSAEVLAGLEEILARHEAEPQEGLGGRDSSDAGMGGTGSSRADEAEGPKTGRLSFGVDPTVDHAPHPGDPVVGDS